MASSASEAAPASPSRAPRLLNGTRGTKAGPNAILPADASVDAADAKATAGVGGADPTSTSLVRASASDHSGTDAPRSGRRRSVLDPAATERGGTYAEDVITKDGASAVVGNVTEDDFEKGGGGSSKLKASSVVKLKKRNDMLDPGSVFMRKWDVTMMVMMLFTALVTPFEVAFLSVSLDPLFVVNRIVDLVFLVDLFVNFFAPYQGSGKDEGQWVHDGRKIAKHYLTGWFTIDFVSLLPFDLVGLSTDDTNVSQLKVVRVVRLFRLLKLFRVLRAKRIMKRWETLIDLNYKVISLVKFGSIMSFVAHWMACGWSLTGKLSSECSDACDPQQPGFVACCPDTGTWINHLMTASPFEQYAASLYWAVMTLSTIGYGDITPVNPDEQAVAVFCMLCGASLWAYVVGNVCGVVASLDQRTLNFRQTMDDLNYFMSDKRLPQDLQRRLRDYFHQARHMHQNGNYVSLFGKMSPKLRGDVALATNNVWIGKVHYFKHIRDDCLSAIAVTLRAMVYAPNEILPGNELHIVMRGVAAQSGRIITRGNVWGEDMILENEALARLKPVRALTYIEVSAINREELFDVLDEFPRTRKKIQRAAVLMAFVRYARRLREDVRTMEHARLEAAATATGADGAALGDGSGGAVDGGPSGQTRPTESAFFGTVGMSGGAVGLAAAKAAAGGPGSRGGSRGAARTGSGSGFAADASGARHGLGGGSSASGASFGGVATGPASARDLSALEERLQSKVGSLIDGRIGAMEARFAAMNSRLEALISDAGKGASEIRGRREGGVRPDSEAPLGAADDVESLLDSMGAPKSR